MERGRTIQADLRDGEVKHGSCVIGLSLQQILKINPEFLGSISSISCSSPGFIPFFPTVWITTTRAALGGQRITRSLDMGYFPLCWGAGFRHAQTLLLMKEEKHKIFTGRRFMAVFTGLSHDL